MYYSYMARRANFSAAGASCSALGGSLVLWKDAESQYALEQHFHDSRVLGKYYWLGISRPRPTTAFAFVDGSPLSPLVSNTKPYAHWWVGLGRSWLAPQPVCAIGALWHCSPGGQRCQLAPCRAWTQPAYAQAVGYNCALAWKDLAYGDYTAGRDLNMTSLMNMSNYDTDPRFAQLRYGWTAYDCAVAYPYICQMRPEAFPCMPPPNPPSPPPLPPSPPSPPAPPSCKWPRLSSSAVEASSHLLVRSDALNLSSYCPVTLTLLPCTRHRRRAAAQRHLLLRALQQHLLLLQRRPGQLHQRAGLLPGHRPRRRPGSLGPAGQAAGCRAVL
jgi:hypothetical protein